MANDLTLTGAYALAAPSRFGAAAFRFTSAPTDRPLFCTNNDHPTLTALAGGNLSTHALTVEGWFSTTSTVFQPIFAEHSGGGLLIFDGPNGTLKADGAMVSGAVSGAFNLADGNWHHLATVYDGAGGVAIYADGNRVATGSASTDSLTGRTFHLGGWLAGTYFRGAIDECRVSNVARYSGTTYTVPTDPFVYDASTEALWHFDSDLTNNSSSGGGASAPTIVSSVLDSMFVGTAFSQTLSATGDSPITWTVVAGALPSGVALFSGGVISGTPTTAGTGSVTIQATNAAGSDTHVFSWTATATGGGTAPTISTSSLNGMSLSTPFSQTLVATGTGPLTWTINSGSLPSGITLSSGGVISGTPTATGTGSVSVRVSNSNGSDTRTLAWVVSSALQISTADANLRWSPYSWLVTGSTARTSDYGAKVSLLTNATSISLNFASPVMGMRIGVRVNYEGWRYYDLSTTSIPVTFPQEAIYPRNLIEMQVMDKGASYPHYNAPGLTFTGFTVNSGAVAYPMESSSVNLLFLGDSITAGMATGSTGRVGNAQAWSYYVGEHLGGSYSIQAYSNGGIGRATSQGVPRMADTWNYLWQGQPKVLTPAPDAVLIMLGGGIDSLSTQSVVAAGVDALIASIQSALPTTKIVFVRHTHDSSPAVQWVEDAVSLHSDVSYIDTTGWIRTSADRQNDATHHWGWYDMTYFGPRVLNSLLPIIFDGTGTPPPPEVIYVPTSTVWDGTQWVTN